MADLFDTLLLLALPASGQSEVRRYLAQLDPDVCGSDFHMGPTVQLDDFPYVHIMRLIDVALGGLGRPPAFFGADDRPFASPRDWGTLIQLINEDYADLRSGAREQPESAGLHLMGRLDAAANRAGAPVRLGQLPVEVRDAVARAIEDDSRKLLADKHAEIPDTLDGKTIVIEFARGGPEGASLPLPDGYGYRASLAQLSPEILERSVILYIWVTPEESRRKNADRADPNDPGSILHHGVPEAVMRQEYGCDDMDWLEETSGVRGTVSIEAHGRTWQLPIARFDNRRDKTSFIRADRADWKQPDIDAVHGGLRGALEQLHAALARR